MAFVTLKAGTQATDVLRKGLQAHVKQEIGAIAVPDRIRFTMSLPKTRSGKIMRRLLRKIAVDEIDNLGDTSTLADPAILKDLMHEED
jgi:acetyl-CoA synthetase